MTHDLLRDMMEALGAQLERVVITELRSATYYAELQLKRGDGPLSVSSRPSDAVALAVRTGSPLYVADDLMEAEGILLPSDDEGENGEGASPEELVGEFRQFLDKIRPEDFSS
jgi:bifunctional DNase/RNase